MESSLKNYSPKKEHGGLDIPDIQTFIQSRKIKWIIKIRFSEIDNWNKIGHKIFTKLDEKYNEEYFLLKCSNLKNIEIRIPKFYKECLLAWSDILKKTKQTNKEDVLNQYLFGNHNILNQGKSLFFPHWCKSDLKQVKDLWNTAQNVFYSGAIVFEQLIKKDNWIVEYEIIKKAIPKSWLEILSGNIILEENNKLENNSGLEITHQGITKVNSNINPIKLTTKEFYYHCLYPCEPPSCIFTWKNIFESFDWKNVCKLLFNPLQSNSKKQFHWKTVHRVLYCEDRLARMGKSNGICTLCNLEGEDIVHMLIKCNQIKEIWTNIAVLINKVFNVNIILEKKSILFGLWVKHLRDRNHIVNLIIFDTKWQIWKNRNCVKYGKEKCKSIDELYRNVDKGIKDDLKLYIDSKRKYKLGQILSKDIEIILNTCI